MSWAYIVVGERQTPSRPVAEDYYAVCHSIARADELCEEAAKSNPFLEYRWIGVKEEEDKDD